MKKPSPSGARRGVRSRNPASAGTRAVPPAETAVKDAINQAFALFNRRWVLRILWELRNRSMNFRELQEACGGLSSSVLSARLAELKAALLVQHEEGSGYGLSDLGRSLLEAMQPLLRWAPPWAARVASSAPAQD